MTNHLRVLALSLLLAGLSACSVAPRQADTQQTLALAQQHQQQLQAIQSYQITGRIAVQTNQQGFSGGLQWQHSPDLDNIDLLTPLGSQAAQISRNAQGITLTTADKKNYHAQSAEALTQSTLGWQLPMQGLSHWALGKAGQNAIITAHNADGTIQRMQQDGWEIQYDNYQPQQSVLLPAKITLRNPNVYLKLVVQQWQIATSSSNAAIRATTP